MTATWDALQASDIPIRVRALRPDEVTNDKASRDLVVVVEPTGEVGPAELAQFFADKRETLRTLLCEHGSVLFRGFPVERAAFAEIVGTGFHADRYLWMFPTSPGFARWFLRLPVIGWMTRTLLGWIERTATGRALVDEDISTLANDQTIQFPHHEYGIFFNVPHVIAFYCDREAGREGETVLCDAKAAYRHMSPVVRDKFEQAAHIRYRSENQWYLPPFTAPAILHHPIDQHPSMNFTAYHHDLAADIAREMFPGHSITTDDHDDTFSFSPVFVGQQGETYELDDDDVADIARTHFEHAVLLPWKQGDILLLDNFRLVHGRLNAGTPRKVLQLILCDYIRNENHFTW